MIRSEQDDVAEAVGDQLDAPQDERAHQDLAQLGVGLHQREQVAAIELDHFSRFAGARPHQRPAVRQHVDLAGELSAPMHGDHRLAVVRELHDLDRPLTDQEERDALLAFR